MKLEKIEKITNFKYLNLYKLKLKNKKGNQKDYFVASRRDKEDLTCVTKDHNKADGVMIIPITIATLLMIYNIRDTYCVSDLISEVNSEMVKITSDDKYMIIPSSCSVNLLKTYISTNEKWYIKNLRWMKL